MMTAAPVDPGTRPLGAGRVHPLLSLRNHLRHRWERPRLGRPALLSTSEQSTKARRRNSLEITFLKKRSTAFLRKPSLQPGKLRGKSGFINAKDRKLGHRDV